MWTAAGLVFAVLATANAAGYRYGVSDQAFYIPVVIRALDPAAFPRDAALIDSQGRLMLTDEALAAIVRVTGASLDAVFLAGYLISLAVIWAGVILIGSRVYASRWATLALGAALTLRHRIPRTSANSFEPYFHPRMLAFGIGLLAIAAVLRRRPWTALTMVVLAGLVHVTTGLWFGITIVVALVVLDRRLLRIAIPVTIVAAAVGVWALTLGPLRASLVRMDAAWLQAVASKDSLFASDWPLWAWIANLGMLAVLWWALGRRSALGRASSEDRALARGVSALVIGFLVTLPLVIAHVAFPVQLQISRVFWLVDVMATIYVLSLIADPQPLRSSTTRADADVRAPLDGSPRRFARMPLVAALLILVSLGRGIYIINVEHPERSLFSVHLEPSAWHDAMRWLSQQPEAIHVLADPGHSWKYGTSVRVSAARDVFLEDVKDSAIAIYSRDVAVRFNERSAATAKFDALTADRARDLATHYGIDYLVTTQDIALPVVYRNDQFRIYALRPTNAKLDR